MFKQPTGDYLADFAKISPDVLSSLYEIGFSNSNIQRLIWRTASTRSATDRADSVPI